MRALLGMMDLERRWPVADRLPSRKWSAGRAVLTGDAAHPTLQSLAQGACMAVEDAVVLAECLAQSAGHEGAFAAFEKARLLRTARVQLESRALWQFFHCGEIEREVRNETWEGRTEAQVFDCLAWLYDGFDMPAF